MPSMSPDHNNVKLESQKRKRTDSNYKDKHSDSASDSSTNNIKNVTNSPTAAKSVFKVPEAKPKKIDLRRMSSASPKRIRLDSGQSQINLTPSRTKKTHSRSGSVSSIKQADGSPSLPKAKAPHSRSGSISSLSRVAREMATSPSSHRKTPSLSSNNAEPPSVVRSNTPDTEMDDNASVTESVAGIPARRTEKDRIQYFKNQPECGNFDENYASCTRCGKKISLGRRRKYAVPLWEKHRTSCDQKPPRLIAPPSTSKTKPADTVDANTKETPSHTFRSPRTSVSERISILQEDEQAIQFDELRVKCRNCQEWIILDKRTQYGLFHWNVHKTRCTAEKPAVPSDRVAAAERSMHLVNDPQAQSFSAHQVECAVCEVSIALEGDGDYSLSCWDAHKMLCSSEQLASSIPETNSIPFPKHPSPSSVSTDDTVVVADATNSASQSPQGVKRIREDLAHELDDADARPSNRPRKEAYQPPIKEAPGPLGWFLLPFTSFMRGFRESLKNGSA